MPQNPQPAAAGASKRPPDCPHARISLTNLAISCTAALQSHSARKRKLLSLWPDV